jgi:hypothetical protein
MSENDFLFNAIGFHRRRNLPLYPNPPEEGSCEKFPKFTPTLPLPRQEGGNFFFISTYLSSSPRGEGGVRGHIPIFSHLQGDEGGFDSSSKD